MSFLSTALSTLLRPEAGCNPYIVKDRKSNGFPVLSECQKKPQTVKHEFNDLWLSYILRYLNKQNNILLQNQKACCRKAFDLLHKTKD